MISSIQIENMFHPIKHVAIGNLHSEKCLDVRDFSDADGTKVQQWDRNPKVQSNQLWTIEHVNNGWCKIISEHSGKYITFADWAGDSADLETWPSSGEDNQLWRLDRGVNGKIVFTCKANGKCMDVPEWSKTNGSHIHCWEFGDHENQKWFCVPGIRPQLYIIFDTSFLRVTAHPFRYSDLLSYRINYLKKGAYQPEEFDLITKPTWIVPMQVQKEIELAFGSENDRSICEAKQARGNLASILGKKPLQPDLQGKSIPPYQPAQKGRLGPDSFVDRGILALARLLSFQPFTVVFIETRDGGIAVEAARLFGEGHLIGCPAYIDDFVKTVKRSLDPHWEAFREGVERYVAENWKWSAEQYVIRSIRLKGEVPPDLDRELHPKRHRR